MARSALTCASFMAVPAKERRTVRRIPSGQRAQQAMFDVLSGVTVAEMADQAQPAAAVHRPVAISALNIAPQFRRTIAIGCPLSPFAFSRRQCFNRVIETGVLHELWG